MPIEFDPTTSTYYATSYTGTATPSEPTEAPPPPPEEPPPAQEAAPPPSDEYAYQEPPPPPSDTAQVGSVVDEVV